ncbi:MAG: DnaB-like helicase C-terminal domain-containing protein [Thermoanaerobaculia bacterium]
MNERIDPEELAIELRRDLGITTRSFNIIKLLREAGIAITLKKLPPEMEGLSITSQARDLIVVDTNGVSPTRLRFTLAHELGHQLLGHSSSPCSTHSIHEFPKDNQERDANKFAVALLMPPDLFSADVALRGPAFREISSLAELYGVSLTAAAIRYMDFTEQCCALVCIRPSSSNWFAKSKSCKGIDLRKSPGVETLVSRLLRGDQAPEAADVPLGGWVKGIQVEGLSLREEVIRSSYDSWLVLLTNFAGKGYEPSPLGHSLSLAEAAARPDDSDGKSYVCQRNARGFFPLSAVFSVGDAEEAEGDTVVYAGFADLDSMLGGFRPGQLVVIAGRRGCGKTGLGLTIVRNIAVRQKKPVQLVVPSGNQSHLSDRLVAAEADVPLDGVRSENCVHRIAEAHQRIRSSPLRIWIPARVTIQGMKELMQKITAKKCRLAAVDYAQLVTDEEVSDFATADEGLSSVVRKLKHLAREFRIPIVLISTVARGAEVDKRRFLQLHDLAGTSSFEDHADAVILLQSPAHTSMKEVKVELTVAKNRHGPTGRFPLIFDPRVASFKGLE